MLGLLCLLGALLSGIWSMPNTQESKRVEYWVLSFVVFMPVSIGLGWVMTKAFGIPLFLGPVPGAVGFLCAKPLERWIDREAHALERRAAAFLLDLARQDGPSVHRMFMLRALELKQTDDTRWPSVDELIKAYNRAREQNGLEPVSGLKSQIQ